MQGVQILMPSGMMSRLREFVDIDAVMTRVMSYIRQMNTWPKFEAWIIVSEDGVEISREHVKTE